jgi:hypothetical protein
MTNLIGDFLYPDNPKRRNEINQLQIDALKIEQEIVNLINSYNQLVKLANDLTTYNVILRALAETSKNPFKEEPLRQPEDLHNQAYTEAMASSILGLAARISGAAAFGSAFTSAIKAFLNRPIASAAQNIELALAANMRTARVLGGAEEVGAATGGVMRLGEEVTRASKYIRALRVLKFSGGALVMAVGVEVILGWIEGSRERDALEENIKKLRDQKTNLEKDRDDLKETESEVNKVINLALEQFNQFQKELSEISGITPVMYAYKSLEDAKNALNAQKHWCQVSGSYLESVMMFHRKWGNLFAEGKEPTPEARHETFADLVTYGKLPNKNEGERRYQIMRRIDMSMKPPSALDKHP